MPEPDTHTGVLVEERPETRVDEGDHERFAHYANKNKAMESALTGAPVVALCGKVWVPGRDAKKFPVCPLCKEIYEGLRPGNDDGGKGDQGGDGGSGGSAD